MIYRPSEANSQSLRDLVKSEEEGSEDEEGDGEGEEGWEVDQEWEVDDLDDFKGLSGFDKCDVVLCFLYDAELTGEVLGEVNYFFFFFFFFFI